MKRLIAILLLLSGCALPSDYPFRPWRYPSFSPLDDSIRVRQRTGYFKTMATDSEGTAYVPVYRIIGYISTDSLSRKHDYRKPIIVTEKDTINK